MKGAFMRWQLALVQHPMYFLIKEDETCAERTPPWGEPNIELYIERVRQNLAALRQYPQLKIGYEWSGLELELLSQDAPDIFKEMCALAREGRVAFYNGTYAQPHLQTLSSEANYRQFEVGARVYRELCEQQVLTYAHQEASVHDQVPQLLDAFGIRFGILPSFWSMLAWLEEGELAFQGQGPRFVQGHEFVNWRGLDGTEIPLYLHQSVPGGVDIEDWIVSERMLGLLAAPPIQTAIPDMIAIDEQWLARYKDVDLVLLDDALEERLQTHPPRAKARHFSNWSYIEGIRAEELARVNWQAEAAALQAEALNALALAMVGRPAESTRHIWKTILTTQHHDVYCFCSPGLKEITIPWLRDAERKAAEMTEHAAQAVIARMDLEAQNGQPVVILSSIPHPQAELVAVDVSIDDPEVVGARGNIIPVDSLPLGDGSTQVRFLAETPGLGYTTYWVRTGGRGCTEEVVEGTYYRAEILPDGTFTSLALRPSGEELLDTGAIRGNQLAATDSTDLSPSTYSDPNIMEDWQAPQRGPELRWEPTSPARLRHSPLGATMVTTGQLGDRVKVDLTVRFYHQLPRIDLDWTFDFDTACIGTFYDDETKLRVHWPLSFSGSIHHDIPFGVIQVPVERPFFPARWVDVCDGKKGLAYFHQGTIKHWVKDGILVNLFAWGEETEAIGSRLWRHNWRKTFDQRLRGKHEIRCALFPHAGDWRRADVTGAARSYGAPPQVYLAERHGGELPASLGVVSLTDAAINSTAVKVDGEDIICRVYGVAERACPVNAELHNLQPGDLRSLSGESLTHLRPFQIGTLVLGPREQ
jgi:hypothetical protein